MPGRVETSTDGGALLGLVMNVQFNEGLEGIPSGPLDIPLKSLTTTELQRSLLLVASNRWYGHLSGSLQVVELAGHPW
jgi:hypothetical protein